MVAAAPAGDFVTYRNIAMGMMIPTGLRIGIVSLQHAYAHISDDK